MSSPFQRLRRAVRGRVLAPDDLRQAEQLGALAALYRKSRRTIESQLQGHSMEPTIAAGTRLRIQCSNDAAYTSGQIVAVLVHHKIIAHRIVYCGRYGQAKHYLLTQGDGMFLPDPPVKVETVLGPVIAVDEAGMWRPPGKRVGGSVLHQLGVAVVLAMSRVALECHVTLAQRLVMTLRVLHTVAARRLSCWQARGNRRCKHGGELR